MTMLSRVAERLYWMARYKERAEDSARLTSAYTNLLMDLPIDSGMDWKILVDIFDSREVFHSRQRAMSEQNVLKFLLADTDNPSSIFSSLIAARENVRTTRDVLPSEAWECTNELYLYAKEAADKSVGRRNRYAFLDEIITRCQQINGLLLTTLSRDHAYRFIKLGHLIERADMTTRVIDVGSAAILERENHNAAIDSLLWKSLLHSLSSITSYKQYIGPIIEPDSAVDFVLKEASHPRSVIFCLRGIRDELDELDNSVASIAIVEEAIDMLGAFSAKGTRLDDVHAFIDKLQLQLCEINSVISDNWFLRP